LDSRYFISGDDNGELNICEKILNGGESRVIEANTSNKKLNK